MQSSTGLYVQFGCGLCAPTEWVNFDVSPALRLQRLPIAGRLFVGQFGAFPRNVRYGDIVRGLPIEQNSCDAVYCSHVLEHLSLEDMRTALKNVRLVLKPGGVFRFVLPDLEFLAREFVESGDTNRCSRFMRETYLGKEVRERGIRGMGRALFGNSQHLWMWDFVGMREELLSAGFTSVRRATFGDSEDSMFALVEEERRWVNQLGVESVSN